MKYTKADNTTVQSTAYFWRFPSHPHLPYILPFLEKDINLIQNKIPKINNEIQFNIH